MCLSIVKPANVTIEKKILKNGFFHNPDGAGYAYAKDDEIIMEKGFFSIKDFLKAWATVPADAPALIHFRQASHGAVNKFNCHPWQINDDFVMIHNGMLFDFGSQGTSDTGDFTRRILTPLFAALKNPREDFQTGWFRYILNAAIEKYNKINILSRWGDVVTLNEREGIEWDGCWHSNSAGFYNIAAKRNIITDITSPTDAETLVKAEDFDLTASIIGSAQ